MPTNVQILAIGGSAVLLLIVLELVRRRRLFERYALLWLLCAVVLLGLSIWGGLLETVADTLGVDYPPSALFLIAFGFILLLLLHFSVVISRLSDQTKVLAQRLSLAEQRIESLADRGRAAEDDDEESLHVARTSGAQR